MKKNWHTKNFKKPIHHVNYDVYSNPFGRSFVSLASYINESLMFSSRVPHKYTYTTQASRGMVSLLVGIHSERNISIAVRV